jgi:hypothetical protein
LFANEQKRKSLQLQWLPVVEVPLKSQEKLESGVSGRDFITVICLWFSLSFLFFSTFFDEEGALRALLSSSLLFFALLSSSLLFLTLSPHLFSPLPLSSFLFSSLSFSSFLFSSFLSSSLLSPSFLSSSFLFSSFLLSCHVLFCCLVFLLFDIYIYSDHTTSSFIFIFEEWQYANLPNPNPNPNPNPDPKPEPNYPCSLDRFCFRRHKINPERG